MMAFTWFGLSLFYLTFYYLVQSVLTEKDSGAPGQKKVSSPFKGNAGEYVFEGFRQLYIFIIIILFIVSLGNRPQGSKFIYLLTFILFAIIMVLMIFLTVWVIFFTVQDQAASATSAASVVSNPAFLDIFITIMGMVGCYFLISLMHGDPWHMITCSIQYLLLLPVSINILPIYAFCNIHDVSWGTKGDNKVESLGSAKITSGKDQVEVELPFENAKDKRSLNADYDAWLSTLKNKPRAEKKEPDMKTKVDDYFKSFRTRYVLSWMLSNAVVIFLFTYPQFVKLIEGNKPGSNPFLAFIFYSFLGITGFRFIMSSIYLFIYWGRFYGSCRCC